MAPTNETSLEAVAAGGAAAQATVEAVVAPARFSVSKPALADLSLLLVTIIWGTTFVIVKEALVVFPPFTYIAVRFTLAAAALGLIAGRRLRNLSPSVALASALVGAFTLAGFALQTFALKVIPASTAAFLTGLNVVIVPFVALLWLRHRPGVGALIGVSAATVGLGLISINDDFALAPGDLLAIACALAFALQIVAIGRYAGTADVLAFPLVQLVVVAAGAWIAALCVESPLPLLGYLFEPEVAGSLLYIGVVATALVLWIQNTAQRYTSPTHTALIFTMEPVFAAFFAWLWLGEMFTTRGTIGGLLILAGTLAAELWPRNRSTSV